MIKWLEIISLRAETRSNGSEIAAESHVSHGDILCAKCVTAYDHVSAARDTDVQMLLQMEAVSLSGKHTVPWSNL